MTSRYSGLFACLLLFFSSAPATADGPQTNRWGPFAILLGKWTGIGSGSPGEGSGSFSFAFDLDSTILVRRTHSEYPPKAGEKTGIIHDDFIVIYPDGKPDRFRADYFDNEGHVIHYAVSWTNDPPGVVFTSDSGPGTARYKLVYSREQSGLLTIEFFIAPPGGELKRYLKGSAQRSPAEN